MDFSLNDEHSNIIKTINLDKYQLFVPRATIRETIRLEVENHLRNQYNPGIYKGQKANEIAKYLFDFNNKRLRENIKKIAKQYFLNYLLLQYDFAAKIHSLYRTDSLNSNDSKYWTENGPLYRKTIGYLLDEMISCTNYPNEDDISPVEAYITLDTVFVYCEHAIKYSIISNEIHYLNDSYKIKIYPPDNLYFIESLSTPQSTRYSKRHDHFVKQSTRDNLLRDKYVIGIPFDRDWAKHGEFLNDSFKDIFDMTYYELMYIVTEIIIKTKEIKEVEDIPLIPKDRLINDIATQSRADRAKLELFFNGLILKKEHFVKQSRSIWKYKQHYRINRRPLIEIQINNETHLIWSNEMLKERLNFLDNDFIFKTIPKEWNSESLIKSTSKISNYTGLWFEAQVKQNLNKIGIIGDKINDRITAKKNSIDCRKIGGFDFIGYSTADNIMVVIECKFIDSGFEPKSYYDDLSEFVDGKKSYVSQLDKKIDWLTLNFQQVKRDLSSRLFYSIPKNCNKIGAAFFTYVMTFASGFDVKYPCVSFTEFLESYEKKQKWYFKKGIITITEPNA